MPHIHLYTALSIDGYIAREDGSIDWLESLDNREQVDHGYSDFLAGVDTVVMGRTTYEQVVGFGVEWPYDGKKTYVMTRQPDYDTITPETQVANVVDDAWIRQLHRQSRSNIWLVGGGEVNAAFLQLDAIDEMILSVIPVVLGAGKKLFAGDQPTTAFMLQSAQSFSTGVVNLHYRRVD